jgi:hypothetical protein
MTISCNKPKKNNMENTIVGKGILTVPFPTIQIPKASFLVSNQRDTVLSYKTGTKIKIPKNAFLDKEGNPLSWWYSYDI